MHTCEPAMKGGGLGFPAYHAPLPCALAARLSLDTHFEHPAFFHSHFCRLNKTECQPQSRATQGAPEDKDRGSTAQNISLAFGSQGSPAHVNKSEARRTRVESE